MKDKPTDTKPDLMNIEADTLLRMFPVCSVCQTRRSTQVVSDKTFCSDCARLQ